MLAAPIVAGNCVIAKPAEDSGLIAGFVADIMLEAGLPAGVLQFLPGVGEEVGEYLTTHAKTRFITFTGSRGVGLHINEVAAKVQPGQKWIKKVILELGGKDGMIVDETADLRSGRHRRCAGRVRLQRPEVQRHEPPDRGGQRVRRGGERRSWTRSQTEDRYAARTTPTSPPWSTRNPSTRSASTSSIGKGEGKLLLGGETPGECGGKKGYYVQPTIFGDVPADARIAQEEIFGPVISVIRARDWQDALDIANSTEYGLTGGVCSRDRARLEQARDEFEVGNLYFNRKITGAIVGVQPFGGYNMSGTDSKAGGPEYLANFMQLKAVTERF